MYCSLLRDRSRARLGLARGRERSRIGQSVPRLYDMDIDNDARRVERPKCDWLRENIY